MVAQELKNSTTAVMAFLFITRHSILLFYCSDYYYLFFRVDAMVRFVSYSVSVLLFTMSSYSGACSILFID